MDPRGLAMNPIAKTCNQQNTIIHGLLAEVTNALGWLAQQLKVSIWLAILLLQCCHQLASVAAEAA
jgi:hypothetical protein